MTQRPVPPSAREDGTPGLRAAFARPVVWLLTLLAVLALVWTLRAMTTVFVPLILAFFLALVVHPLDRMAEERLPRRLKWLGHVLALAVVILVLMVFLGCLWLSAQQLISRFQNSDYTALLPSMMQLGSDGGNGGEGSGGVVRTVYSDAVRSFGSQATEWISGMAQGIANATSQTLAGLVLVIFLMLMMLIEADRWQAKLQSATSSRVRRDVRDALTVIASRLRRYLLTRTAMGAATALLYAVFLWFFGLDLLIVWALLTFVFNFVPTIGSMISGILPVAYAFLQKDPATAAMIAGGILVIEQVMGNFIDPRVQGKQISVSPLVVLAGLVVWGWIWGAAGALLAVPITIAMIIFFSHVESLRPVALFLSNETSMDDLDRATEGRSAQSGDSTGPGDSTA